MSVQKQGKKNRKLGRDKDKCNRYRTLKKREYAKYRRIAKYSIEDAIEYAKKHSLNLSQ